MNRKTAMVIGSTSGIGAAFARKFANLGYDLVITGRRKEKINILANDLRKINNVTVEVVIVELSDKDDLDLLIKKIKSIKNLDFLVNSAGFAKRNKFHEENIETSENMLKVHSLAIMKLTYAALPCMIANKQGSIINISSIMAFFPFYMQAMYTATKAFVSLFTESLNLELKGTGVRAQALCPGLTLSDFHEKLGLDVRKLAKKRVWLWKAPMKPEEVVKKSLKCLKKNKVICIPGIHNKLIVVIKSLQRLFL